MREYERRARAAVDRMDVLDEVPRSQCHVRGCERQARYEWAGAFGVRWLCPTHRKEYWVHDRIVRLIHSL